MLKHRLSLRVGMFFILLLVLIVSAGVGSAEPKKSAEIQKYEAELKKSFTQFGWKDIDMGKIEWESHRKSHGGRPLMFSIFGEGADNTFLFLGGVHGDESPSVYMMFKLSQFLKEHPELVRDKQIVIAPLVNPDGFFSRPPKRTNSRGVDVNRNFPTRDWKRSKKDKFYTGPSANSESETKFQIALINRFKPTHILSMHSPLGCYDYDGPSSDFDSIVVGHRKISKQNGLPFRRYKVYPGSLGNYAGMEKKIHTLTLELPSSDPKKGAEYFNQFKNMLLDILAVNP